MDTLPFRLTARFTQGSQAELSIGVIPEDIFTLIDLIYHLVEGTRKFKT